MRRRETSASEQTKRAGQATDAYTLEYQKEKKKIRNAYIWLEVCT